MIATAEILENMENGTEIKIGTVTVRRLQNGSWKLISRFGGSAISRSTGSALKNIKICENVK